MHDSLTPSTVSYLVTVTVTEGCPIWKGTSMDPVKPATLATFPLPTLPITSAQAACNHFKPRAAVTGDQGQKTTAVAGHALILL